MSIKDSSSFQFTLTGVSPLIMRKDDVESADLLEKWREDPENKNKLKPHDGRSPSWAWQTCLHVNRQTGKVTIPSSLLSKCLQATAETTIQDIQFFTTVNGKDKEVSIADVEAIRNEEFTTQASKVCDLGFNLDVRQATIPGSVDPKPVCVRPRFDHWKVKGTISVTGSNLQEEGLQKLFDIAGDHKGIGDCRPGCNTPGTFGRFKVELKKVA